MKGVKNTLAETLSRLMDHELMELSSHENENTVSMDMPCLNSFQIYMLTIVN